MPYHGTAQVDSHTGVLVGHGSPRGRFGLFENFAQVPGLNADIESATENTREPVNRSFEVLGANMTSALATFADGGGCTVTTAGADLDQAFIIPHLDTKQSAWAQAKWNSDDEVGYECLVELGATITNGVWIFGMCDDTDIDASWVAGDDDDEIYVTYHTETDTNWTLRYSVGATDYSVDLGVKPAASTHYGIQLVFDKDRFVDVYLSEGLGNYQHRHRTRNAMTTNIDLKPRWGVEEAGSGAARAVTVRYVAMAKTYND